MCWDRDSIYVSFESYPPKFKALASFSPANNGFNNKFDYTVGDVDIFKLRITNEKGRLVWSTENPNEMWQGEMKNEKTAPKGNYSWSVSYSGVCTFWKNNRRRRVGQIILIAYLCTIKFDGYENLPKYD